ncbi:hypothetical protein CEN49_11110 [Fischerella thermalis CCMEE 5273]|nr:hypothetical protein CEN49_11110 [Fischerella thermalis CCMEE 5273]
MTTFILVAFILIIARWEWVRTSGEKPMRLRMTYTLLYGINITLLAMLQLKMAPLNPNDWMIWLLQPIAEPMFRWISGES